MTTPKRILHSLFDIFPVQALDAVSPPPAEQEQRVGKRVQFKLLLDHPGQTVYSFAQIGIAAGDVDLVGPGKVVQHDFKIRSIVSTVVVSAPEWISTVAPAMRIEIVAWGLNGASVIGVTSANWTSCCAFAMVNSRFCHL